MEREQCTEQTAIASGDLNLVHQPDTLVLSKYVSDRTQSSLSPEKRLMLAVLEDAIFCFQECHAARQGKRKQTFDSARQWFFDPVDDRVFSFENICLALELEPQYVRSGLLRWLKRHAPARPAARVWRQTRKRAQLGRAMAAPS